MRGFRGLRPIAILLAVVVIVISLPQPSRAAMIGTEQVIAERAAESDRERLIQFLARQDVRRQMEALGVNRQEAAERVGSLSDEEVRVIAGHIDQLPAGQGALETAIIVAGVLFIVLIITDLLGITEVFAFIR